MWIAKYGAFLDMKCEECKQELDFEIVEPPSVPNATLEVRVSCACTDSLKEKITTLEEEVFDLEIEARKLEG